MPTHRDDEEERILETYRRDDDEELMETLDEASRRRKEDDAFKLHFPVPRDRTMRRLAISQLILLIVAPVSCVALNIADTMNGNKLTAYGSKEHFDPTDPYDLASAIFLLIMVLSLIALFVVIPLARSSIMTRRYGWRAIQDPIEAHRVAVREGMADVLTANLLSNSARGTARLPTANSKLRPIDTRR